MGREGCPLTLKRLRWRAQRGSVSVEMLFIFPLLLMMLFMIVEAGFLMYDLAVVNYAASVAAVESARMGKVDQDSLKSAAEYARDYGSGRGPGGAKYPLNYQRGDPGDVKNQIVVWSPQYGEHVQRNGRIEVNIVYPVEFKMPFFRSLATWLTVEDVSLTLKGRAVALGEVYWE